MHVMPEDGVGLCVAKRRAGDGLQRLCRGREVEKPERPEKKKVRVTRTKRSVESEEERVALWVPQALRAEEELINVVWAMHNLVMRGVSELEEWRKEARADQKLLQELLQSLGEKVAVEKAVAEVVEKKVEVGVVVGKVAEAEGMDIAEVGVEAEEGEVVVPFSTSSLSQ